MASDNGKPFAQRSAVQVVVNIHEKQQSAPQWQTNDECKAIITVDEDIPVSEMEFIILSFGEAFENTGNF